jgi:hypothetical protein
MSALTDFAKIIYVSNFKPACLTAEKIIEMFKNMDIGVVSRVDFIKKGKGAYIYIDYFYGGEFAQVLQTGLSKTTPYKWIIGENNVWNVFEARNPLPASKMNIHQLYNKCMQMDYTVQRSAQEINRLTALTNDLQHSLYQLLGGLYNHTTQAATLKAEVADIGLPPPNLLENEDTSIWEHFPTTRQGDALEYEFYKIDKTFRFHIALNVILVCCVIIKFWG